MNSDGIHRARHSCLDRTKLNRALYVLTLRVRRRAVCALTNPQAINQNLIRTKTANSRERNTPSAVGSPPARSPILRMPGLCVRQHTDLARQFMLNNEIPRRCGRNEVSYGRLDYSNSTFVIVRRRRRSLLGNRCGMGNRSHWVDPCGCCDRVSSKWVSRTTRFATLISPQSPLGHASRTLSR
jgi:hypothetical protein